MLWNDHHKLEGRHAFLGASNSSWINYNDDLLIQRYFGQYASEIGTLVHEIARDCIKNRIKLNKHDKHIIELYLAQHHIPSGAYDSEMLLNNLLPYVNDAIGFHMTPEVILYYSENCFGTTDAICFDEKTKTLRIHDLKTGTTAVKIQQLLIYAALFCLEYHKNPKDINIVLCIYQNFEGVTYTPEVKEIQDFMDLIQSRDQFIVENIQRRN